MHDLNSIRSELCSFKSYFHLVAKLQKFWHHQKALKPCLPTDKNNTIIQILLINSGQAPCVDGPTSAAWATGFIVMPLPSLEQEGVGIVMLREKTISKP